MKMSLNVCNASAKTAMTPDARYAAIFAHRSRHDRKQARGLEFANMLAAHAEMEDQVTYPTTLLIGRYVKSCVTQGAR